MTAMPPTKGHLNLVRFAASLPVSQVTVLVCTQPEEPYAVERFKAVEQAAIRLNSDAPGAHVWVRHLNRKLEQNSQAPGFWPMWDEIMREHGFKHGDLCVSSEGYGATLAGRLQGHFVPYDPQRELYYTKATSIRENMVDCFADILPEFQKHLVTRVTIFGAESTGKTTLSKELAEAVNGHWLYEWARPYLELTQAPINAATMGDIWRGQGATQKHAGMFSDKPFIIQDTDLFSTIGYWDQPHWRKSLGMSPEALWMDAWAGKSDLYLMTSERNVPFEPDPLRYGIDHRESGDEYWETLLKMNGLPYEVLDHNTFENRLARATALVLDCAKKKAESIYFEREANGR
jgi:NadR type nicotinamide-nucleotide adenylyltransferase